MKIDTLRFKNINSLKGEWTVNFDQPPLVDAGVFAITGPNGSGKSSILDAITLALYGETFKFDHPSAHVMTKQTDDSFAEVVFTLGGKQFRSSWSAHKTEGKLAPPEMQIISLIGDQPLAAGHPGKVRDFIADLTGMDFRRFTRSIVLAQGDFAAFLNALDNERLDILEKIVGSDIYDDYQLDILSTAELEHEKLNKLEQSLVSISLKSPAEIEAIEHDLLDFHNQIVEGKQQRQILEQQNASIQAIATATDKITETEQAIAQYQAQTQQINDEIAAVDSIKDFVIIESGVETLSQQQQQLSTEQDTLSAYRSELSQIDSTIAQLTVEDRQQPDLSSHTVTEQIANLESLKDQLEQVKLDGLNESEILASLQHQLQAREVDLKATTEWLQAHQTDEVLLDAFPDIESLKNSRNDIAVSKEEKAAYLKKIKTQASAAKKKETDVNKLQKEVEKHQLTLQKQEADLHALQQEQTLEQVQDNLAELEERLTSYKGLVVLADDYSKLPKQKGSGFFSFGSKAKPEPEITEPQEATAQTQKTEAAAEYAILVDEQEQAITELASLEKAVAWEARLKQQEAERKLLVDDEACCLCGATEHPYAQNPPPENDSRKALANKQKQVTAFAAKSEQLKKEINKFHERKQGVSKNNKLRIELESYWLELCTKLNKVSADFTIDNQKAAKKLLAEQNKAIADQHSTISKHQTLQQKVKQQQALLEHKTKALEATITAQQQLITEKVNPQTEKTLELTLADNLQENQELTSKVTEQLEAIGEKLPGKGREDKLLAILQRRQQALRDNLAKQQTLQQELTSLATDIDSSQKKKQQLKQQLQACTTSLHASEVASLHLAMVEKQKLIIDKEQRLAQQQETIKNEEKNLTETLETMGISDIRAAQDLIEDKQQIPQMQQALVQLGEQSEQLKATIEPLQAELKICQEQALTTQPLEQIVAQQKAIGSQLSIANQEIRTAESLLAQQDSLRNRVASLQEKIQQQTQLYEHSQTEADKLATASPAQIKRQVQQVMIDQLMTKSNQFLENISGRYCIHQRQSEQGLALVIEDKAEGGTHRSPQTLSGGEGFIVSLSLALGLSGMATGGQAVESLFLDEGFGTLDEETLYIVLSTLQSLHHSGKMVGVISHVKELKERIRTQIRLTKEMDGHSSLEVVS